MSNGKIIANGGDLEHFAVPYTEQNILPEDKVLIDSTQALQIAESLIPSTAPRTEEGEPAEITAIRKASTFPFPSATAKFPPLPGLGTSSDSVPPDESDREGFLKKLLLLGALGLVVLVAAGFA